MKKLANREDLDETNNLRVERTERGVQNNNRLIWKYVTLFIYRKKFVRKLWIDRKITNMVEIRT